MSDVRSPLHYSGRPSLQAREDPSSLADLLERILDKGIVIAGDISISLVDVELLTIRLRLLVASVDRAREMGVTWWESDRWLTGGDDGPGPGRAAGAATGERLDRLEDAIGRIERALDRAPADPDRSDGGQ